MTLFVCFWIHGLVYSLQLCRLTMMIIHCVRMRLPYCHFFQHVGLNWKNSFLWGMRMKYDQNKSCLLFCFEILISNMDLRGQKDGFFMSVIFMGAAFCVLMMTMSHIIFTEFLLWFCFMWIKHDFFDVFLNKMTLIIQWLQTELIFDIWCVHVA